MSSTAASPRRTPVPSRARLWLGLALAPAAWCIAELVGYIGAGRGCFGIWSNGRNFGPSHAGVWAAVVSLLCLGLAAVGGWIAVDNLRRIKPEPESPRTIRDGRLRHHAPVTMVATSRFMAVCGTAASALFMFGILLFMIQPLFIHACERLR